MRKPFVWLLTLIFALTLSAKDECVCFKLEGEFGEEIRAILQKYMKNLGEQNIKVVREDAYDYKEKSFVDSLLGINVAEGFTEVDSDNREALLAEAGVRYAQSCASCHGPTGAETPSGAAQISTLTPDQVLAELQDYLDGEYVGQARFLKRASVENLRSEQLEALAEYVSKLDDKAGAVAKEEAKPEEAEPAQ